MKNIFDDNNTKTGYLSLVEPTPLSQEISLGNYNMTPFLIDYDIEEISYSEIRNFEAAKVDDLTYPINIYKGNLLIKVNFENFEGFRLAVYKYSAHRATSENSGNDDPIHSIDEVFNLTCRAKNGKEKSFRFSIQPNKRLFGENIDFSKVSKNILNNETSEFEDISKNILQKNIFIHISGFKKNKVFKVNLFQYEKAWLLVASNLCSKLKFNEVEDNDYPAGIHKDIYNKLIKYHHFDQARIKLVNLPKITSLKTSWAKSIGIIFGSFVLTLENKHFNNRLSLPELLKENISLNKKFITFLELVEEIIKERLIIKKYEILSRYLYKLSKLSTQEVNEILILDFPKSNYQDENNNLDSIYIYGNLLAKLFLIIYRTEDGTILPSGKKINTTFFTKNDCFFYWLSLQVEHYKSNLLEEYYVPAIIKNGELSNNKELNDPDQWGQIWYGADFALLPKEETIDKDIIKILEEAIQNKIYTIPYGATFELKDPNFRYIKIYEELDEVNFFVVDENGRFLHEEFKFSDNKFSFGNRIFNINTFRENDLDLKLLHKKRFHTVFATLLRDFWTVIDREKNLGPVRQISTNRFEEDKKLLRYVYLPRIRYSGSQNSVEIKNELKLLSGSKGGWRTHSLMKLRNNFKPSPLQLLLASKNGIKVPDGYTYKKAHSWGRKEMAEAEVIYRSRNLTGLFFESESYKVKAREIVDMSPLKFEEYCVKVIEKLNWNTTVSRPKDGGIDIEAYKDNSKGEVVRLFAQCKHHKNNINPNILRELLGSKECENNDFITELMIITSGKFSSGCSEIANEKNIILIDGNDLLKLNVKNILN